MTKDYQFCGSYRRFHSGIYDRVVWSRYRTFAYKGLWLAKLTVWLDSRDQYWKFRNNRYSPLVLIILYSSISNSIKYLVSPSLRLWEQVSVSEVVWLAIAVCLARILTVHSLLLGENRKIFHEQECEKTLITLLSAEVSEYPWSSWASLPWEYL